MTMIAFLHQIQLYRTWFSRHLNDFRDEAMMSFSGVVDSARRLKKRADTTRQVRNELQHALSARENYQPDLANPAYASIRWLFGTPGSAPLCGFCLTSIMNEQRTIATALDLSDQVYSLGCVLNLEVLTRTSSLNLLHAYEEAREYWESLAALLTEIEPKFSDPSPYAGFTGPGSTNFVGPIRVRSSDLSKQICLGQYLLDLGAPLTLGTRPSGGA